MQKLYAIFAAFMRPDYPSKIFSDQRNAYIALIVALAMDSAAVL